MPKRVVYLVRHGQAASGDGPLTTLGRTQATFTAARVATLKQQPTSLVSSTLLRARQTAAILGSVLPGIRVRTMKDLCEGFPARPPEALLPPELQGKDGNFFRNEALRHARAFRRLTVVGDEDSVELVVAHGNVIAGFIARALGADPSVYMQLSVLNCSLSQLVVTADAPMRVVCHNDSGHLPAELITWI